MGGHAAGEVASRIAVEALRRHLGRRARPARPHQLLQGAARAANLAVRRRRPSSPGAAAWARRCSAWRCGGTEAVIAHVGDSRAYLVRGDDCTQLTTDHSRVGEMLRMRLISAEQAANHPARSQLTRSLGGDPFVQVDLVRQAIQRHDTLVLCSDGLWDVVGATRDRRGRRAARRPARSPTAIDAADRLVQLAVEARARLITSRPSSSTSPPTNPSPRRAVAAPASAGPAHETPARGARRPVRDHRGAGRGRLRRDVQGPRHRHGRARRAQVAEPEPASPTRPSSSASSASARSPARSTTPTCSRQPRPGREPHRALPGARVRRRREPADPDVRVRARSRCPSTWRIEWGRQLASVIAYLHANGIAHRDLKPENILVTADDQLKVIDFGTALLEGAKRLTWKHLTEGVGTPNYMSPEQIQGERGDTRSDIYAWGIMMYEFLTGRVPFDGDNWMAVMAGHLTKTPEPIHRGEPRLPARRSTPWCSRPCAATPTTATSRADDLLADLDRLDTLDPATFDLSPEAPMGGMAAVDSHQAALAPHPRDRRRLHRRRAPSSSSSRWCSDDVCLTSTRSRRRRDRRCRPTPMGAAHLRRRVRHATAR